MTNKLRYAHCCVDLSWSNAGEVEALTEFIDTARDITRKTFNSRVDLDDRRSIEQRLGYAIGQEKGLHAKSDYHIRYLAGTYHDKPAVAMVHSAIEYMFTGQ